MLFWSDSEFPSSLLQVEESSGLIIPSSSHALSSSNHGWLQGGGIRAGTNSRLLNLEGWDGDWALNPLQLPQSSAVRLRPPSLPETILECSATSLFQENLLNWAGTQSVFQCLIPANCIRKNLQLSSLWSQGLQCIPQVLSSLFSRIPNESYGIQDLFLLFFSP